MQYSYWALLQGFILVGFVTIECIMLGQFVGWLHIPSYVIGAGLIGIGLCYRINKSPLPGGFKMINSLFSIRRSLPGSVL